MAKILPTFPGRELKTGIFPAVRCVYAHRVLGDNATQATSSYMPIEIVSSAFQTFQPTAHCYKENILARSRNRAGQWRWHYAQTTGVTVIEEYGSSWGGRIILFVACGVCSALGFTVWATGILFL